MFVDAFEPQAGLKTNYRATDRTLRTAIRLWHRQFEDHRSSRRAESASPFILRVTKVSRASRYHHAVGPPCELPVRRSCSRSSMNDRPNAPTARRSPSSSEYRVNRSQAFHIQAAR